MDNQIEGISEHEKSLKTKYEKYADAEGFIPFIRFCGPELNKQAKNIAAFIDGDGGGNSDTNFAVLHPALRFKGDSGDYDRAAIHMDDLDEFIVLVKKHYGI